MSSFPRAAALAALCVPMLAASAEPSRYVGIGRPATPQEVAAWDIDVRADFKGLPKGSGTVAKGMEVWDAKCAGCHGVFGESNEVFTPIVGGTGPEDIRAGRVARLKDGNYPGRTTLMKLSNVSTLWDYINRAMPWTAPKTLTVEEVYAVTAYILNLGGVVPDDFVLSDANIAQVQARLPNRHGMQTDHGMWPGPELGHGRPDVQGSRCMRNCPVDPKVASLLPEHARNAHGNLADQNRLVGAQRGSQTAPVVPPVSATAAAAAPADAPALVRKHACVACHATDQPQLGPAFREVARKYAGRADAATYLAERIRSGSSGVWGAIPMPAQSLPEADATAIARWLAEGAR
ncbi:MAG TPA: c-type cytochrome [Burkholderiaceae bacterium]|nr:c-type cytochrome [Burkholderiaceae bacterium]